MPKLMRQLALTALAVTLLSSCASDHAENRALLAAADKNPGKDAIVGMWHRKAGALSANYRQSVLFKSDGTGVEDYYLRDSVWGVGEGIVNFTWSHDGHGTWTTKSPEHWNYNWVWRVSQGKLIRNSAPSGLHSHVFERVSP